MSRITESARAAGYQAILPLARGMRAQVLDALRSFRAGLTAEEVAATAGLSLNNARSRLTELCAMVPPQAFAVGKRESARTGVRVTVFRAVAA